MAKKWSLARISVYRRLLSATERTPVKGKGSALPGQALSLLPSILSASYPGTFVPTSSAQGGFQSLGLCLERFPPLPFLMPIISAQRSRLRKSILSPTLQSVQSPRSGLSAVAIWHFFVCLFTTLDLEFPGNRNNVSLVHCCVLTAENLIDTQQVLVREISDRFPSTSQLRSVLASCGCCNKRPQARRLNTTELYSLPVLEMRSPQSGLPWKALG